MTLDHARCFFTCVLLTALLVAAPHEAAAEESAAEAAPLAGTLGKPYQFGKDWFGPKIPHWTRLLEEFAGRPGVRYLEIGVYEGRSLLWMVDHVLTHDTSRAAGVDIFVGQYKARLLKNIQVSGAADRIAIFDGFGELVIRDFERGSFDIIYLDGGHAAWTVFEQAALSWQLLKEGGLLIFDDYKWFDETRPADLRPEITVDAFLAAFAQQVEVLHQGRDVFVRKVRRLCEEYYCSDLLGRYVYHWAKALLFRAGGDAPIELSDKERKAVENLLLTVARPVDADVAGNPTLVSLFARLDGEAPPAGQ